MIGSLRSAARFLCVMLRYRRAGVSFLLRGLRIVPGFRCKVAYLKDRYQVKQQIKQRKESIGHALGDRTIVCSWAGRQVCSLVLPEGVEATADQFFLNRPICDARHLIALARPFVRIRPGELVFDPGCGAGRHLYHFVDALGCRAIGVDIYKPAIDVAQAANWDRRVRFLTQSSIESGFLDSVLPHGCDFVFINSWLNHVKDYVGYPEFARRLVDKCRYLLVITSAKDELEQLFERPCILVHEVRGGTQFALMRGTLPQPINLSNVSAAGASLL
jgi:SAM-dependent methyltransferase